MTNRSDSIDNILLSFYVNYLDARTKSAVTLAHEFIEAKQALLAAVLGIVEEVQSTNMDSSGRYNACFELRAKFTDLFEADALKNGDSK
jgi:hypothetical protein